MAHLKDKLFLAIDLGTSACKVLVVDRGGKEIASASVGCAVHQPHPDRQEQGFEEVWKCMVPAVKTAAAKVNARSISAIAFSSVMHGFMPVDKNSRPLMRMMTWADGRALKEAEKLASGFRRGYLPAHRMHANRALLSGANYMDEEKCQSRFQQDCEIRIDQGRDYPQADREMGG